MNKRRHRHKKHKSMAKYLLPACIIVIIIFSVFIYFTIYFKSHFFFRSEINNLSVSGLSLTEAQNKLAEEASSYLLTIYDRDGNKYHISASDIDYQYIPGEAEATILEGQKSYQWIAALFSPKTYSIQSEITYDSDKLSATFSALPCCDEASIIEPVDAYIEQKEDSFEIVPEVLGNHLIFENALATISSAIGLSETQITFSDSDYEAPSITSDDAALQTCMNTINQYLQTSISYEVGDNESTTLDTTTICKWLSIGDDFTVSIDSTKLTAFVQALASKYNTYADVRNFLTSKGDVVQIGGGDYGWIVDKEGEAAQIQTDLASGTAITREPVYQQTAISRDKDDIGNSYVEIDYTNQHLWYYQDGALVTDTDIVSGNFSNGNGSPDGIFKIVYKQSPAVLKGEDYESDVTYFMPFAYNVGIHDASWRSSFGKEIYRHSGSHGCINVPLSAAKTIFETISTGTPVVAYYRETAQLTSNSAKVSNAYSYVDPETLPKQTTGTTTTDSSATTNETGTDATQTPAETLAQ